MGNLEWRGGPFQRSRRPVDTSESPKWRALFEPLVPVGRLLELTHRLLRRIRGAELGVAPNESTSSLSAEERLDAVVLAKFQQCGSLWPTL